MKISCAYFGVGKIVTKPITKCLYNKRHKLTVRSKLLPLPIPTSSNDTNLSKVDKKLF